MQKSERLFQLVDTLRSRRTAITAKAIAAAMNVSERTVYRDIQSLLSSGVPIEGEAGIGYRLGKKSHVPPLMFTEQEVLALVAGINMVKAFTDPELATAAGVCEAKIRAVLPEGIKRSIEQQPYRIPVLERDARVRDLHQQLRRACEQHRKVHIRYTKIGDEASIRVVWPLALVGFFGAWLLLAWCELRKDYRNFRIDRIGALNILDERFEQTREINPSWYFKNRLGITDPAHLL